MTVYSPEPQNQFYRLRREAYNSYSKTTRWGTKFDHVNCMATAGSVGIDAHTEGRIKSSPVQIRANQGDQTEGIGIDDVAVAWKRLWGITLIEPAWNSFDDSIEAMRDERRGVIYAVDYSRIPYDWRAQKDYLGPHAMFGNQLHSDGNRIQLYDSLNTKFVWMPISALRAGAEAIAIDQRGTRGYLFLGYTKTRQDLSALWGADIPEKWKSLYTSTAVAKRLTALGVDFKTRINRSDIEEGLERRRIYYGDVVNTTDLQALMR